MRITKEQFYCNLLVAERNLDKQIEGVRQALVGLIDRRNSFVKTRVDLDRIEGDGFRLVFFEDDAGMRYEVETRDCGFPLPNTSPPAQQS